VKKSERVGVLGCKGTILVEFSAIRNKKSVSKRQRGAKKNKIKKKPHPKRKRGKERKNSVVLAFFLVPLLSCMHCLLELHLIQV
jgi:hypothetical protein